MSLPQMCALAARPRFPRVSGDEPHTAMTPPAPARFSPRERG